MEEIVERLFKALAVISILVGTYGGGHYRSNADFWSERTSYLIDKALKYEDCKLLKSNSFCSTGIYTPSELRAQIEEYSSNRDNDRRLEWIYWDILKFGPLLSMALLFVFQYIAFGYIRILRWKISLKNKGPQ